MRQGDVERQKYPTTGFLETPFFGKDLWQPRKPVSFVCQDTRGVASREHRKNMVSFGGIEATGQDGGLRCTACVRGLSVQCVLRSDQTRTMEHHLDFSVVTRMGAHTETAKM